MQTIALNPSPQLRTMANTVFGYTGNKFEVAARESVIINSHWGGGSREYFALVDLETQRAEQYGECGGLCQPAPITVVLSATEIVIKHTIFCGKDLGITFYCHEAQRKAGITETEYGEAKSDLISQGLLNRAGAITPNGRNALTMAMGSDLTGLDQLRRD